LDESHVSSFVAPEVSGPGHRSRRVRQVPGSSPMAHSARALPRTPPGSAAAARRGRALVLLVLLPLLAAALLQRLAPQFDLGLTMVPLMMLVLAAVALSQTPRALGAGSSLLLLVPLYLTFAVLAATAGMLLARLLRLEAPEA